MKNKLVRDGKLFGRVSLVDIFAVLLVLGLALMVYFRFTAAEDGVNASRGDDKITFELKISPVRHYSADRFKIGQTVYVTGDEPIGEVTDIRVEQATSNTSTLDGRIVQMPIEDRLCVYLTVEGSGRYVKGSYFLTDTLELRLYDHIYFYTKDVATSGTVISLDVEEAAE